MRKEEIEVVVIIIGVSVGLRGFKNSNIDI